MHRNLILAAIFAIGFNIISCYTIIYTPLIESLFPLQKLDPYAAQDNIVLVLCIGMASIIMLMGLYTLKVRALLTDINNLTREREREREVTARNQKLEALGLLAAGVSHEINTCLQVVLGSCEMALNRKQDPEQCAQFIQRAIDNSLHARRVIKNVLVFSNSNDSKPMGSEDLSAVVKEAVDYSQAYLSQQVKFDIAQAEPGPLHVNIDRTSLHQAISNLANNASQAMNHRGTIFVSTGKTKVDDSAAPELASIPPGTYAYVKLRDTGSGIEPENLARIFDPFYTTKPIGEGTGLGLSMVHGLIKSMNGHVTVSSTPGNGTEFSFFLPMADKGQRHENA